ncbi:MULTISPECIES: AmmeMemoRadiSam system radical SAM enzyme [unclassified Halanaerobium]|uniref:AmmeMemoRadiSam system radical SAM enzyme n=1 Tax=unclassified Halanaerobium TaxID=2641197 RepID=UPI000DF19E0A|nr:MULTISPECIES: AmmeMemoRadiSam system radical SAM enzyme [unclassified Halanaerobium]RCW49279.1 pyruvate formate lyase activating enzyme [Halanaerobium sp. MA284_MarDTE_T2]RCW84018.1 pyruvate formate lyase activating enzyme [Halanaerobium sp. DL-01]
MAKKEALYYSRGDNLSVHCKLCPHNCLIKEGKSGICRVRKNEGGRLYSLNYNKISSLAVDPVEKKPLYHFYPGSKVLSVGTYGCNFSCTFCQNWQISQETPVLREYSAEEIIAAAEKEDIKMIAFTYSEPIVWYEYVKETAELAKKNNIKTVLVSNGFIEKDPLEELIPFIDAANIDLKSFNSSFYKKYCGGSLEPVKNTIKIMAETIHLELTNLIITDLNDSREEIEKITDWIASINKNIPLHLSRYYPANKLKKKSTDPETLKKAYQTAKRKLSYIFLGNINIAGAGDTICSNCGETIINRSGYSIKNLIKNGKCPYCKTAVNGQF